MIKAALSKHKIKPTEGNNQAQNSGRSTTTIQAPPGTSINVINRSDLNNSQQQSKSTNRGSPKNANAEKPAPAKTTVSAKITKATKQVQKAANDIKNTIDSAASSIKAKVQDALGLKKSANPEAPGKANTEKTNASKPSASSN